MHFEIVSLIAAVETIAEGHGIRELARLRRCHGAGHWKKKKGIGRREEKIKTVLRVLP